MKMHVLEIKMKNLMLVINILQAKLMELVMKVIQEFYVMNAVMNMERLHHFHAINANQMTIFSK